jgi:dipeptidase E
MKKLFLTSSFAGVSKFFPDFINNEKCTGKTVTFIPTASNVEKVKFYVGTAQKAFKKLGLIIDELDISKASREEIVNKLERNDYIYVSGGNTFYLLQELKRRETDKVIIDQINKDKIYIGESAGSIIMSPNIEYVGMVDDKTKAEFLDNYQGLGVVDFYPLPHYTNFPFKKIVEKILAEYKAKLNLHPISNKQAITVCGDKIEQIG